MSQAKKDKPSNNPFTPETRAKISAGVKRALSDPETKARVMAAGIEARNTPEVKAKQKAAWADPEKRKNRLDAMKAGWDNPGARQRASVASKKHRSTPEAKQKTSEITKARWNDPDARQHSLEAIRKVTNSYEYRCKMSEFAKRQWADPEIAEKMIIAQQNRADNLFLKPSSLEMELAKTFDNAGILYIQQYRPDGYWRYYDFYLPGHKLLIEVDGEYWHSLPDSKAKDVEKTRYAMDHGYMLLRIPEAALERAMRVIPNILRLNV